MTFAGNSRPKHKISVANLIKVGLLIYGKRKILEMQKKRWKVELKLRAFHEWRYRLCETGRRSLCVGDNAETSTDAEVGKGIGINVIMNNATFVVNSHNTSRTTIHSADASDDERIICNKCFEAADAAVHSDICGNALDQRFADQYATQLPIPYIWLFQLTAVKPWFRVKIKLF